MRLFGLVPLLICLCSQANAATPASPKVTESDAGSTQVSLTFDQPMLTWNERGSMDVVRIDPQVACQWFWTDDTTLICRTANHQELFRPASSYHLHIDHGLWSQDGGEVSPSDVIVATRLPDLRAEIHDWKAGVPQLRLTTDWQVTPESIAKSISVDIDGHPLHSAVVPIPDSGAESSYLAREHTFELQLPDLPLQQGVLHVNVHPGLKSSDGPLPGKQDMNLLTVMVNEPFGLRKISCGADPSGKAPYTGDGKLAVQCAPEQPIGLYFSRSLDANAIAVFKAALPSGVILIEPKDVNQYWDYDGYEQHATKHSPDFSLYLKSTVAGSVQRIDLPAGFAAEDGSRLPARVEIVARIGDYPPAYELKPNVLVAAEGSVETPDFKTRNMDDGLHIMRMAIGDQIELLSSHLRTRSSRNTLHPVDLPATPAAIRDQGGLVFAGAQDNRNLGYAIAYAPFNVLVSRGDGQLLVWASTWGESRNLAKAEVELLSVDLQGHQQVLGTAVSSDDGVALLDIPPSTGRDDHKPLPLLVRVTHEGKRTLVPVSSERYSSFIPPLFSNDSHSVGQHKITYWQQFSDGSARTFGVTDRPLYRPGEAVHYRIWYRQRKGNRLLRTNQGKVTLAIRIPDRNKTLAQWPATLDALGSNADVWHVPALVPDGEYCIDVVNDDVSSYEDASGACFQIARFEAQALWAHIDADRKMVLAGQDLGLSLDSGYFSGDAAADVAVQFNGLLTPKRLEDTYPAFAAYTFIHPYDGTNNRAAANPLSGVTTPTITDRKGRAQFSFHLPKVIHAEGDDGHAIVFGLLEFNADISVPGKASANSGTAEVNYSRYSRYVGLKSAQWWLPIDRDPGLEAVVISHDGHAVSGQAVKVSIEAADDADAKAPIILGHCLLNVDRATPCAFRATKPGLYRFRASVEGAESTVLERWIGGKAPVDADKDTEKASLKVLRASDGTTPARVELSQPYPSANVLFTLEYGKVVFHWVQAVTGEKTGIDVPVHSQWAPGVTLHALIRASDSSMPNGGFGSRTLDATLDLDISKRKDDAIGVTVDHPRIAPGQDLLLHLANPAAGSHHATIAVVDDSIYQQAIGFTESADPTKEDWLGSLDTWDASSWYGLEGWQWFRNPFFMEPRRPSNRNQVDVFSSRIRRAVDYEAYAPVTTLARADVQQGGASNLNDPESKNLERIEVVGSRIRTVDIFQLAPSITVLPSKMSGRPGKPMPRVRSRFVDSAYWNPDVSMVPGETKDLRIHLPDNLTRWRVLVWASDDNDGFALSQTTVETALPIELRTGVPGQLYVGDKATASVSARNHGDKAAVVALKVQVDGAGVHLQQGRQGAVAGNAEISKRIALAPDTTGEVQVLATAHKIDGSDALSSSVPVLSSIGEESVTQTGWIDSDALDLPLPLLPDGATLPVLDVQINRGLDGWRDGWLRDLRDYPNRCWEQTLSRAVGAALAISAGKDKTLWSNAQSELHDALVVAPAFQDEDGNFRYFLTRGGDWTGSANPALSAYTLRSFELLQALGFVPPQKPSEELTSAVTATLEKFGKHVPTNGYDSQWEAAAESAGALLGPKLLDDSALHALWNGWANLSWYGRSELVRALARKPAFASEVQAGIQRLREAGTQHGLRRVIDDRRDFSYFMGSNLRDQCGVVGALYELDKDAAGEMARRSLLRGLQDLYSGGTASLDTQSSAQCLMALQSVSKNLPITDQQWQGILSLGNASHPVTLAPQQKQTGWSQSLASHGAVPIGRLMLQSQVPAGAALNYTAQIRYQLDLQQAKPHAVGMRLERSYQVLRNRTWVGLDKAPVREGDWVRVRLVLDVPTFRHFVAITDVVPGGLVSRDISLSSVGGADMKRIAELGSMWFDSRQTGQNRIKIYAEQLPPGTHEVYYYAQAVQPGDYFAPPAIAELMYGRASRSSTSPSRIVINPAPPAARH